jgi:8-oxo-dGTP pyrophosphatase MutT (NUDIX family)
MTMGHYRPQTPWAVLGADELAASPEDLDLARAMIAAASLDEVGEEEVRGKFLNLLDTHAGVLDRRCRPGHLTGSAVVVAADGNRVLVLWHNKARRWLQPGGHADGDGNLAHVAWREATEETGIVGLRVVTPAIHLDIHEFRPPDEDAHLHFDVRFVVLAPPEAVAQHNHESSAVRWVTLAELGDLDPDPGLVLLAERGRQIASRLQAG